MGAPARRLAVLALALGAGCSGKSPGDPAGDGGLPPDAPVTPDAPVMKADMAGGGGNQGTILAHWKLAFVEDVPGLSCEAAGTPNVTIKAVNSATKATTTDKLPCAPAMGSSRTLPIGAYDLTVQLEDAMGRAVSAVTITQNVSGGANDIGDLLFSVQSFKLSWAIDRGGTMLSCVGAQAANVELRASLGSDAPAVYKFPCTSLEGETTAVRVGTYTLSIRLLDMAGTVLSEVPPAMYTANAQKRALLPRVTFGVR
jgi:hypothetical protein